MKISFNEPVYISKEVEPKNLDLFDLELEIKEGTVQECAAQRTIKCSVRCGTKGCFC